MTFITNRELKHSCRQALKYNGRKTLLEALSWSIFLSRSLSRERGWSRTVKVYPSFRNWSSSWFCGSLRGFCSGPTDFCTHGLHSSFSTTKYSLWGSSNRRRKAVPSCSSWSLWSAGIHQTGTGRRRSASCSLGMDQNKDGVRLFLRCESAPELCSS